MNTMDPFTAGKLVNFKQADLRAEAEQTALRAAMTEKFNVSQRLLSIGVIQSAARVFHRVQTRLFLQRSPREQDRSGLIEMTSTATVQPLTPTPPLPISKPTLFVNLLAVTL